jgi:hypothetical protein
MYLEMQNQKTLQSKNILLKEGKNIKHASY